MYAYTHAVSIQPRDYAYLATVYSYIHLSFSTLFNVLGMVYAMVSIAVVGYFV